MCLRLVFSNALAPMCESLLGKRDTISAEFLKALVWILVRRLPGANCISHKFAVFSNAPVSIVVTVDEKNTVLMLGAWAKTLGAIVVTPI